MDGPERNPCPECGKLVTWTRAGRPRQHKCEPKSSPPVTENQQQPASPGGVTPGQVIAAFIATRDEISALKKKFDELIAEKKELQSRREAYLLGLMNQQSLENMKTSEGTVFVDWKDSARVSDREAFLEWVHEDWENRESFLENRVSKSAVKQRHEDGEQSPPGVSYAKTKGIKIRRS